MRAKVTPSRAACASALVLALLVGLVGHTAGASRAAVGDDRGDGPAYHRSSIDGFDRRVAPSRPAAEVAGPSTVLVELAADPVAVQEAASQAAGAPLSPRAESTARATLRAAQDGLRKPIAAAGGEVTGAVQQVLNGLLVRVPNPAAIAAISALPGVTAVHRLGHRARPATVHGVPAIGAPAVWAPPLGFTGTGVKIGIIDTGIDYFHSGLGGSGDVADFTADDSTSIADGTFPTAKVVGGWDFVGDAYDGFGIPPSPDPDPVDCGGNGYGGGHGSHVASIAAGNGVLASGEAFAGPYDGDTLADHEFSIGPGVAPEASLYAYRVFGCSEDGFSDDAIIVQAIERAVLDGVDVINMSLSSTLLPGGDVDVVAAASEHAIEAGVVVVSASSNDGPAGYQTGSPGSVDHVIDLAALDAAPTLTEALMTGPQLGEVGLQNSNYLPMDPPVTGALRVLPGEGGAIGFGCTAEEYAPVEPGEVVVAQRGGECGRVERAYLGEEAGAVAVVLVNNGPGWPPYDYPEVEIPFLGATPEVGAALQAADGTEVSVTAGVVDNARYRTSAFFSSGGPRTGDSAPKPDLSAPGMAIVAAQSGSGNGTLELSGTSMASPMGAGAAALVVQAHPEWSPPRVRQSMMNTAVVDPDLIVDYDPRIAGTGVLQVDRAIDATVVASTEGDGASLAFGFEGLMGAYRETRSIVLTNEGAAPVTYDLSSTLSGDPLGVALEVSPSSVSLPPGGSAQVDVQLSLTAEQVAELPDAAQALRAEGCNTFAVTCSIPMHTSGVIIATPTTDVAGAHPLRVHFLVVPRGLSEVRSAPLSPGLRALGRRTNVVALRNRGIHAGTADVFAWGLTDPADAGANVMDVRAVGVQSLPGEEGGLPADDRLVVFAVNTYRPWSSASQAIFDIAIDTGGSRDPEFHLLGADPAAVHGGYPLAYMQSMLLDADYQLIESYDAVAPHNSSTALLPVSARSLGLTSRSSGFAYDLVATDSTFGYYVTDVVQPRLRPRFQPFRPSVSQGEVLDLSPGEITLHALRRERQALLDGTRGWMIVTLDDAGGPASANLITLAQWPVDLPAPP